MPEATVDFRKTLPGQILGGLISLPQRAIDASAQDMQHFGEPGYTPQAIGPALEMAMVMMGTGLPMAERGAVGAFGGKLPPDSAAAGSAARQAISEAEATLPEGISRTDFGRLAGFEQGLAASSQASTEATAEVISRLQSAGITSRSVAAFQKFYESEASRNPSNLSAAHRAALLANILRSFQ